jgi:retron-type reverse transcriptase
LINTANIVLLPKTQDAAALLDYRPISLINNIAKIITKLLANRLAPHMNDLASNAQNAFIKKRCVHDNFIYTQRVIQLLHKKRKPALFIKLGISKAFDSIGWSFLLEVIENLGFNTKWRDWIAALLGTTTSRVLINGQPTKEIKHERGLRQGDPLSPLLFILAIDPLHHIIEAAANRGILSPVLPRAANLRCSLYADDATIFASLSNLEIDHLHRILSFFGECSGLKINISKTEIYPSRMDTNKVAQLLQNFPGNVCNFLGKYLGLPLHVRKLRKIDVPPLLDKIGARLPGWKAKFLSTAGRETLVKIVLSSQPIYHMTVFPELK